MIKKMTAHGLWSGPVPFPSIVPRVIENINIENCDR